MRIDEIREQTSEELERQLEDLSEELFNLRFRQATQDLDNPLRIHILRKDIARVKTVLGERERGQAPAVKAREEEKGEIEGEKED